MSQLEKLCRVLKIRRFFDIIKEENHAKDEIGIKKPLCIEAQGLLLFRSLSNL